MGALQDGSGIRRAVAAALVAAWAAPATAQLDGPELAGSYPVELKAQGPGCPSLQRTTFEVRSVNRDRLQVVLDGDWGTGELRGLFEGGQREFYLAYRELDGVRLTGMQGFFERRGANIGVVIAVNFADSVDCTGEFQGSRRAAAPVPAAPAPKADPPPEPGPTTIGPAPSTQPQTAPPAPGMMSQAAAADGQAGERPSRLLQVLKLLGLALLGFAIGFGLVRLFGRRRAA